MKIFGYEVNIRRDKQIPKQSPPLFKKTDDITVLPPGRVSVPDFTGGANNYNLMGNFDYITPSFVMDSIETIRKLYKVNEDVGSVLNDLIQLTNTGHKISFDQSTPPDQVDKMKKHLNNVSKEWASGIANIDSIINKWIAQLWVSGALSNEWIPKKDLSGIEVNALVNPEDIRFKFNKKTNKYEPHQKITGLMTKEYVKLNELTYKYVGLLTDVDEPYGVPPFLTALSSLETQSDMKRNINHILKQLGLLGYLETKVAKPDQNANEPVGAYINRLNSLLTETKKNVQAGFMEGVVVGFEGDHEFSFNSTTKNLGGVSEIYNNNEVQIANGLKTSPAFLGQKQGGTETNMGIVFTKMLSQLKSVQAILASNLEYGYKLELIMAGYSFKSIKVEFKPSTITDDLKIQQSREIKQRVAHALRVDGVIDQETYADEMGYEKPASQEPEVPFEQQSGNQQPQAEVDKATKNQSARKSRDTSKSQPKRKDTDTKKR